MHRGRRSPVVYFFRKHSGRKCFRPSSSRVYGGSQLAVEGEAPVAWRGGGAAARGVAVVTTGAGLLGRGVADGDSAMSGTEVGGATGAADRSAGDEVEPEGRRNGHGHGRARAESSRRRG